MHNSPFTIDVSTLISQHINDPHATYAEMGALSGITGLEYCSFELVYLIVLAYLQGTISCNRYGKWMLDLVPIPRGPASTNSRLSQG